MALNWARDNAAQYGGDGSKLFAMGHSAGAYNVAMATLARRVEGLKGVVTMAGPFDFLPLDSPITIKVFADVPNLPDTQPGQPCQRISTALPDFAWHCGYNGLPPQRAGSAKAF